MALKLAPPSVETTTRSFSSTAPPVQTTWGEANDTAIEFSLKVHSSGIEVTDQVKPKSIDFKTPKSLIANTKSGSCLEASILVIKGPNPGISTSSHVSPPSVLLNTVLNWADSKIKLASP